MPGLLADQHPEQQLRQTDRLQYYRGKFGVVTPKIWTNLRGILQEILL